MDYRNMTAPCGLDCFNCPLYLASQDEQLKQKIAASMGLPLERAKCAGCRNEGGRIEAVGMKEECKVYRCVQARGVEICSDCDDFPCDNLHPYADRADQVPHNTKVFNLALIRKMGLEKWSQEKARNVKRTYFKGKLEL